MMHSIKLSKVVFTVFLCSSLFTVAHSASDTVRLVGNSDVRGRVEYMYSGQWGTVCDDYFDMIDATVVCRELNLGNAVNVLTLNVDPASYNSPIWLDDVECTGEEQRLSACPSSPIGQNDCLHSEDVGVECTGDTHPVRLDSSNSFFDNEGLIEIQHGGIWGTVCLDKWTLDNTGVVCKQLGYESTGYAIGGEYFQGSSIILEDVACVGTEESLAQCPHRPWGAYLCSSEKVTVSCSKYGSEVSYRAVRLVGGKTANKGILEVFMEGRWGTVCNFNWQKHHAELVCHQLGYPSFSEFPENRYSYQIGNTEVLPINIHSADCSEAVHSFDECTLTTDHFWGCDHSLDVALSCLSKEDGPLVEDIRLVGGIDDSEGILEIYHNNMWWTVCSWDWSSEEGDVACKQLGYDFASNYSANIYDEASHQLAVHVYSFDCYNGTESRLSDCSQTYNPSCESYNLVALGCSDHSASDNSAVGTVIGVLVLVIIIISIACCCCCCRRRRTNTASRTTTTSIPLAANQPTQVHVPPAQQPLLLQAGKSYPPQPGQGYPPQPAYPPQPGEGYPTQPAQGYPPQPAPGYAPQPGQGYPPQPGQGYPPQPGQGYPPQPSQGYAPQPGQGYPPQPGQGYPPQPGQGYPPQPSQGYAPQPGPGYPPQPGQGYPPQPGQGYPPQPGQGFPPQSDPSESYPPQPDQGYPPQPAPVQQGAPYPVPNDPAYPVQPSAPQPEPAELSPQV